jgi:hypothetical protein
MDDKAIRRGDATALAPDLPTTESFARALEGFGAMVKRVDLLAECAEGDEAMLLYDMEASTVSSNEGSARNVPHELIGRDRGNVGDSL